MTPAEMVAEFHLAFGVAMADEPTMPSMDVAGLRVRLILEEAYEFSAAMLDDDLVEAADALADLLYVTYGAALVMGIDLDAVVAEVHRANMAKLGPDGRPIYRDDGKVLKPPGWTPPDVAGVLGG